MKKLLLVSVALLYGLGVAADDASVVSQSTNPLTTPSLQAPLAAQATMLAIAQAGPRSIAVGERGLALYSDDGGSSWQQASVPVSVTLTGVSFPATEAGWVIGHAGVVLHSTDAGRTWLKQIDGIELAQLELDAAQKNGDERRIRLAQRLLADGADKPLLAVHFWDERRGVVLGAYGLIFATEDGGASWTSWMGRLENPMGMHLNAISVEGRNIFIAGEQGLLLRSTDSGASFQRLETGYNGSWFAVTQNAKHVVLAGLRGTVYASTDAGESWSQSEVPAPVTILSAVRVPDGRIIYANQAGQILSSQEDGKRLQLETRGIGAPLSSLGLGQDGDLFATSFAGVIRLPMSRQSRANE